VKATVTHHRACSKHARVIHCWPSGVMFLIQAAAAAAAASYTYGRLHPLEIPFQFLLDTVVQAKPSAITSSHVMDAGYRTEPPTLMTQLSRLPQRQIIHSRVGFIAWVSCDALLRHRRPQHEARMCWGSCVQVLVRSSHLVHLRLFRCSREGRPQTLTCCTPSGF